MEKIVMNLDGLWLEVFPRLEGDTHAANVSGRMSPEERITLMAREIRRIRSELARETVGRKRRDKEIARLRQLDIIHKAKNYDCRLI
jgi:hypothetical protein